MYISSKLIDSCINDFMTFKNAYYFYFGYYCYCDDHRYNSNNYYPQYEVQYSVMCQELCLEWALFELQNRFIRCTGILQEMQKLFSFHPHTIAKILSVH